MECTGSTNYQLFMYIQLIHLTVIVFMKIISELEGGATSSLEGITLFTVEDMPDILGYSIEKDSKQEQPKDGN